MRKPVGLSALPVFLLAFLILPSCASVPPHNMKLEEAQSEYDTAIHDPLVRQVAPEQLHKSSVALDKATTLLKQGAPNYKVEHYAYIAKHRVDIAEETAQAAAIQEKIKATAIQRDKMMLEAKQQKIGDLRSQLAALKARKTDRGLVLTLGAVLFDTNKADLRSGAGNKVDKLASFMQSESKRNVMIEGYTDSTGSPDLNEELSKKRANSVRDALINDGINPQRIVTKGFGDKYPVATNKTASGRQENRRVEVVISDENGNFPTNR